MRPSLLIIPANETPGVLMPQIPFNGTADFTVSRTTTPANNSTRVNSSGLIEIVNDNVPRIDYLNQSCPALLVEPAATNFARWVNQMTVQGTPTASGGMTITTGSTDFLAPDGTSGSITKYVGGAASGTSQYAYYSGGNITVTASGQHTFSLFVKRGATNPLTFCALQFALFAGGSGTSISYFNLASGTALTAGASVQDYGNGWYRLISAPYTLAAGGLTGQLSFYMAEGNGDVSWPASDALNLTAYTWGAQLEAGSIATTYIPTTTTTASRAADVISASGALVSGLIGQTEGTIYAEVDLRTLPSVGIILSINTGNAVDRIEIYITSNGKVKFDRVATTESGITSLASFSTYSVNSILKIAIGYKSGDTIMYINGIAETSQQTATFTFATIFRVNIGSGRLSTSSFNNRIRAAALYTTRLSNDDLIRLTLPSTYVTYNDMALGLAYTIK